MIDLLKDRNFQFWEYRVSHGSLLIRSPKSDDQKYNIDVKFFGVEFVSIPRHLRCVVLSNANSEEISSVDKIMGKPISKDKIFVFESQTGRYMIVAATMKVDENELDIFDSPFDL